jgi:hypothetical protein
MSERNDDGRFSPWWLIWIGIAIFLINLDSCSQDGEIRNLQRRVGQLEEQVKQ